MDNKLHRIVIQHWLSYFKIPHDYQEVSKSIPLIKLSSAKCLDVSEVVIQGESFYIDSTNQVFKRIMKNYEPKKEYIGEYIGRFKNDTICLCKNDLKYRSNK